MSIQYLTDSLDACVEVLLAVVSLQILCTRFGKRMWRSSRHTSPQGLTAEWQTCSGSLTTGASYLMPTGGRGRVGHDKSSRH